MAELFKNVLVQVLTYNLGSVMASDGSWGHFNDFIDFANYVAALHHGVILNQCRSERRMYLI